MYRLVALFCGHQQPSRLRFVVGSRKVLHPVAVHHAVLPRVEVGVALLFQF